MVRVWPSRVAAGLRSLSPLLPILDFVPAGFVCFAPAFLSLAAFLSIAAIFVSFASAGGAPNPGTGFFVPCC